MKSLRRIGRLAVFFGLAASAAIFLQLRSRSARFTIGEHVFRPAIGPLFVSAIVILFLLLGLWALTSQIWTKNSRLKYKEALVLDLPTYLPVFFLLLAPLALAHYFTRDDLRTRLGLLLAGVVAAVLYLKAARIARMESEGKSEWAEKTIGRFAGLPLGRRAFVLFLAALAVYAGGTLVVVSRGVSFGGDEPHYLIMTHSLLRDGDLDLTNNYERRDFEAYSFPDAPIRPHHVRGRRPGSHYSFHSPGVAILLVPFYALGLALGKGALVFLVRFGMAVIGALVGIQIYLYARKEWGREKLALGLWALAGLSSPLFFYSFHIYPEIVVALLGLVVFRWLRFSDGPFSSLRIALIGIFISSFVWFHALKYFFIQAPLFILALCAVRKRREGNGRSGRLRYLLVPSALVFLAYFLFQYSLYGSFNPTAVSWQGAMDGRESLGFLNDLLTRIPLRFRAETLAGYFLDQKDGLLLYAPAYLFAFLGIAVAFKRKAKDAWRLLIIAGPYILVSALLTQRTGYAPQARPLVAVIWVLVIFLGWFLAEGGKRLFRVFFNAAAGFGLFVVWLLCRHPFALYQETTYGTTERAGDLFVTLSNLHVYLPNLLPSFLKLKDGAWAPNFFWLGGLAVFIVAFLAVRRHDFRIRFGVHLALAGTVLAGFFAMSAAFPRVVLVGPRPAALETGDKWTFYSLSRVARMEGPGRFAILQDDRDYDFHFVTRRPFDNLEVEFGSAHGDYALSLSLFDTSALEETTRREVVTRTVGPMVFYRWKGAYLGRVSIRLERRSDVVTGLTPYRFAMRPVR
jgi:Ca2+/Na+ antiporter